MAVGDALGVTGGTRRVTDGGGRLLLQFRPGKAGLLRSEQFLITQDLAEV